MIDGRNNNNNNKNITSIKIKKRNIISSTLQCTSLYFNVLTNSKRTCKYQVINNIFLSAAAACAQPEHLQLQVLDRRYAQQLPLQLNNFLRATTRALRPASGHCLPQTASAFSEFFALFFSLSHTFYGGTAVGAHVSH